MIWNKTDDILPEDLQIVLIGSINKNGEFTTLQSIFSKPDSTFYVRSFIKEKQERKLISILVPFTKNDFQYWSSIPGLYNEDLFALAMEKNKLD